ncbi:acyltransferase [Methylibium sp.]|uniref:acyltransferase family protein n=1 Tax=Methylibium sp. TaxID=2067992 RepID=UPI0033410BA7
MTSSRIAVEECDAGRLSSADVAFPEPGKVAAMRVAIETPAASLIRRLQVIRFPLVVSVIFHHNGMGTVRLADGINMSAGPLSVWAQFIQGFISYGLGGIRMPTFFLISGYLFFTGFDRGGDWLFKKMSSRARSVLAPLIVWNAIAILLLLAAQNVGPTRVFFSGSGAWSQPIIEFGWFDYLNALLGISRDPILYPLWFLRDLFLMCLLAPLYFVLPRFVQYSLIAMFGVLWLLDAWPYEVPTVQACFFFAFGASAAMAKKNLFVMDPYLKWVCAVLSVLVIAGALVPADGPVASTLTHLKHLAGVIVVLTISQYLLRMPKTSSLLIRLSAPSFLLFVAHEPLLTIVRKTMYVLFVPNSSAAALSIYFGAVACTVLLILGAYYLAERYAPRTLSALTGGRSA